MWAHLTCGEMWKGEFINRRKDGSEYTESVFISPVRDADGQVTHYLGIKEDITERKRMEQALRENEARYRRITEGLTDYLYTVRIENGCAAETTQSSACVAVTGYTVEEFAPIHIYGFRWLCRKIANCIGACATDSGRERCRPH